MYSTLKIRKLCYLFHLYGLNGERFVVSFKKFCAIKISIKVTVHHCFLPKITELIKKLTIFYVSWDTGKKRIKDFPWEGGLTLRGATTQWGRSPMCHWIHTERNAHGAVICKLTHFNGEVGFCEKLVWCITFFTSKKNNRLKKRHRFFLIWKIFVDFFLLKLV